MMPSDQDNKEVMDEKKKMGPRDLFTAADVCKINEVFRKALKVGSKGLNIEQFTAVMKEIYGSDKDIDFEAIHFKMDTTSEATVNLFEFMGFLQHQAKEALSLEKPFPKPFEVVDTKHYKEIVKIIFQPFSGTRTHDSGSGLRPFSSGRYITVTKSGLLTSWSEKFENPVKFPLDKIELYPSLLKMYKRGVNDMVYIPELEQLAVCTNSGELLFFGCSQKHGRLFEIEQCVLLEDNVITCMDYWSDGTRAVFSLGDQEGFLYAFISYDVEIEGIFCNGNNRRTNLGCGMTSLSKILKTKSDKFKCFKQKVFQDACHQIRYFPDLEHFAICGASSKDMVLVSDSPNKKATKRTFSSSRGKKFFTCVEYFGQCLVTGGMDGLLRLWNPDKSGTCEKILQGHIKPITNILVNPEDGILLSISEDKNVHAWTHDWKNVQSFEVDGLGCSNITSACYNTINNELVVASLNIAKNLGKGTDFFEKMLISHDKPLCCALYHSILKQVISVCQNGVVTVWDIITGRPEMQFKVTPDNHEGHTTISFDSSQRRLITISHDGEIQLWNFSHGKKLKVFPVRVPERITGIICRDKRVFISGLNSKIIFDLDLEGNDHRFMEHQYLDDISSMDLHENLLATASSNGKIVFWRLDSEDSAEAVFGINTSKSLRTCMLNTKYPGKTGSLSARKWKNTHTGKTRQCAASGETVDGNSGSLIYLKTREDHVSTAALLTFAGDFIHAWSPKVNGGLLGKFRAVEAENAVITTMTTDAEERFLLTGDSNGKIYLWDIRGFWSGIDSLKEPFEKVNEWKVSLCPPPLLNSWTAHLSQVMSVTFDSKCEHIITAGLDCNVRVWTLTGSPVGTFGRDKWDLTSYSLNTYHEPDQDEENMPENGQSCYVSDPSLQKKLKWLQNHLGLKEFYFQSPKQSVIEKLDERMALTCMAKFIDQPPISDQEVTDLYLDALRTHLSHRSLEGKQAFTRAENEVKTTVGTSQRGKAVYNSLDVQAKSQQQQQHCSNLTLDKRGSRKRPQPPDSYAVLNSSINACKTHHRDQFEYNRLKPRPPDMKLEMKTHGAKYGNVHGLHHSTSSNVKKLPKCHHKVHQVQWCEQPNKNVWLSGINNEAKLVYDDGTSPNKTLKDSVPVHLHQNAQPGQQWRERPNQDLPLSPIGDEANFRHDHGTIKNKPLNPNGKAAPLLHHAHSFRTLAGTQEFKETPKKDFLPPVKLKISEVYNRNTQFRRHT